MSQFLTPLKIEHIKEYQFILLAPLIYEATSGEQITVPAGSVTDLASVPWFLTLIVPRYGLYTRPAVLHDDLVFKRSWVEAAKLMREAMKSEGVREWRLKLIYGSIRAYGFVMRLS